MTTPSEREVARKEILDLLDELRKHCGEKYPRSDVLTRFVRKGYHELFALADELRGRIASLEEAQIFYAGTFDKSAQYNRGALVTHRGGLWHCQESTRDAPGTSKAWRLTSKTFVARGAQKA